MWPLEEYERALRSLRWEALGEWEPWMHYALQSGGKRLRPWLAWCSYAFYAGPNASWATCLPLLQAIELLHTFTLVHDDVMDNADLRRGQPALHRQTSSNVAILVGDALLLAVYERLSHLPAPWNAQLTQLLSQAALRVCHGQLLDLALAERPTSQVSLRDYEEMITEKTGTLLGAALQAGALLGGADPYEAQALQKAGELLGRFFQIQDDYLDAFEAETGKVRGGDIAEGKKTFLWLWAYAQADPAERQWMEDARLSPAQRRARGLALYEKLNLRTQAYAYLEEAFEGFMRFVRGHAMEKTLTEIATLLRHRKR